jgi:hypothetical protein
MGGIYEVWCFDGLRCHDVNNKFNKDCFRHSEVKKEDSQTRRQHGDFISMLLFLFYSLYFEKKK